VSRRVPIHHGSAPGIGGRAPVSLRRVTGVGRQSLGVSRQHTNINDFIVKLITYNCPLQSTELNLHTKATEQQCELERRPVMAKSTLPFYTRLSFIKT